MTEELIDYAGADAIFTIPFVKEIVKKQELYERFKESVKASIDPSGLFIIEAYDVR